MKNCLVSLTPSHYRKLIYLLMQDQMGFDYVFGKGRTSVKSIDLSIFKKAIEVPNVPIGSGRWYKMPKALKYLKGYDVVVNDMGILCTTSWLLLLKAKFRRQKIYHWDHGWYGREGWMKKWMKRMYFALSDGAFIYGYYAKKLMIRNGFNGSKLHVVHNSLDYDTQKLLRKKLGKSSVYFDHFGNNCPVLMMIGRLNLRKKMDMLLKAVALLANQGKSFNIVLIGDGEGRLPLEQLAKDLGLSEQIWFYGACYDEKINAELIYNSDMCVVPGDIGLTAMHAMMFGTPCITHDYYPNQGPEFEAIQEGMTGSFFKHNDISSLANCISRWFALKTDEREDVRQACYKEIDDNWNPHKQIEIIKKVIYG